MACEEIRSLTGLSQLLSLCYDWSIAVQGRGLANHQFMLINRQEARELVRLVAETSKTIPGLIQIAVSRKTRRQKHLEEYDKQINMVSFWRMTANLVLYYPHWNLHKVVHYILYPIFYRFHPKTHSEMCCQLSEVTPAVLTTPVSQSVSLDVSDKHGSSSRSTTLSRQPQ